MGLRETYQERTQARLRKAQASIDMLKARAEKAGADAKIDYYGQIQELRNRKEHARQRLEELEAVGESAWQDLKSGVDSALEDLGQAVNSATERFRQDN